MVLEIDESEPSSISQDPQLRPEARPEVPEVVHPRDYGWLSAPL